MSFLERAARVKEQAQAVMMDADDKVAKACPALWEYLTATAWPEGGERETATVLIFVEDGTFKGCLNDRANSRSGWASADSFTGLLDALEGKLQTSEMDWRKNRTQHQSQGKKK